MSSPSALSPTPVSAAALRLHRSFVVVFFFYTAKLFNRRDVVAVASERPGGEEEGARCEEVDCCIPGGDLFCALVEEEDGVFLEVFARYARVTDFGYIAIVEMIVAVFISFVFH